MKKQPMYLQRVLCMGMHVLCCLGTQGSSTPPDESALTVHLSNERAVMFMDQERNVVAEKTYRFDTRVRWDRDMFGRAVCMLGREQGNVDVEDMETILRAMASLSTDTESAHVHDTRCAIVVLWDRDTLGRVVQTHGGRLQSKVDAEKMEAILHAMAYQSTGKVDMLHVSENMKKIANHNGKSYKIKWNTEIFEKTYSILVEKEREKVDADDMVKILHLMEHLKIEKKWKEACYSKLARKTKEDYKKAATGLVAERKRTESFSLYMQHLLRLYAEDHGMSLTVDEKRKTLYLRHSHSKRERRENKTGEWMLRVEVSEEYRRQTEVQQIVETLMEVMGIAVEVDIEELKPEDRGVLERIISKGKKTGLLIRCNKVVPGAIAQHIQKLENNIIELDVSWNRGLSDEDWKTVGEMRRLKRLNIECCDIQPGTIARHMQRLKNNLIVLDVSWNQNLCDEDWKTVGEMKWLEELVISYCNVQAGTIARHMQELNLVKLDVSWNQNLCDEDWKTVGEMTRLEWLYIKCCNVQAGTVAWHMQELNLVKLDVSENQNLCDEDWITVREMTRLEWLVMWNCNVQAGTVARHIQELNLVKLDVSENQNLCDEDWKTVGEMTRLEWLYIKCCNVQAGTIARHMQELNLVKLDVSSNENLSDEDWKTVGEMTRLEWLIMWNCNMQAGTVARHMRELKNNLTELDISWNENLCDEDWKTVGEMKWLERLVMWDCKLKAKTIAEQMWKLKNSLTELDVSSNENLSEEDWKTVGEMTRLERLIVYFCKAQEEQFSRYLGGLRCHIEK